jgi:DNA polymerase elongation subunit (family B)/DNA modification methylase
MKIQNIFNLKREVTMFCREDNGSLTITKDNTHFPYYYELDKNGQFDTYDNQKVRKLLVSSPGDVAKNRSAKSYEADILFTKRYVIDKIASFDKTVLKYFFIDIEVLCKEFPDPMKAKDPISCITIFNSLITSGNHTKTWFLKDYKDELTMLQEFINYVKLEQPDLIMAWNVSFDYTYLHQRIKNFAKMISPINEARYGNIDGILYPAGISIMDYMEMFKKIYMREQSYALDKIAQKYLGETEWKQETFGVLDDTVKAKNINDINRMIKIEQQMQIMDYYDEIRRFAMCLWEDLTANSRILDMLVLREARKRNIILPNKKKKDENDITEDLQGAYRRAEAGVYKNIYKADIVSMYPSQMVNFCLDAQNISLTEGLNIDNLLIKQNPDALLTAITKKLMLQKDALKKSLKEAPEAEKKMLQNKYNAIKGLVNSMYGVTAFAGFRLYNYEIASRITFLSRDLLMYVEQKMKDMGYEVIYTDTDALMYKAEKDEIVLLNKLVQDWAIEKFEKMDLNITFESEGMFNKLLILAKCRYYGIAGSKVEIKGLEIKRSNSSKYEADYQKRLINLVLEDKTIDDIEKFVKSELNSVTAAPLSEVSFPAKISGTKEYKNKPIFVRAYENTQLYVKDFHLGKGELFHYIFVKDLGKDVNKKEINVLVLTDKMPKLKELIDWDEMKRRNILMKTDAIFEALYGGVGYSDMNEVQVHITENDHNILIPTKVSPAISSSKKAKTIREPLTKAIELHSTTKVEAKKDDIFKHEVVKTARDAYFSTKLGKCFNEDCISVMKTLPNDSVNLVFTSPPYNTGNKGKNKNMYTEYTDDVSDEQYYNLLNDCLRESLRVCKGPIFINLNYMNNNKKVLYKWVADNVEYLRENIIWEKDKVQPPIGNILGKRYEYIFMFTKDPKFQINDFRKNKAENYTAEFGNWISNLLKVSLKTDQTKFAKTHRAGFPLALPKIFIDIYTKEGDTILEPFLGLGTTALAAESMGRNWIGCELVKKYCDITKERLDESSVS